MFKGMLPLLFALVITTAMAEEYPNGTYTSRSFPVAENNPDSGIKTRIYEQLFVGPSISTRLLSQQSSDGGSTWSTPQAVPLGPTRAPQIVTSTQAGANLLWRDSLGYVLFHHYGTTSPSDIWRTSSADGSVFAEPIQVELGWPASVGSQSGSGFPSVVMDGAASMTMLYQRFSADGSDPAGIYLSRSLNDGLTWSAVRTLVTVDARLGARSMLAYRPSDHRYAATYEQQWAAHDNRVMVKVTDDVNDWTALATLEIPGDNSAPSLVVMPDGAFVLFYGRTIGGQSDLFARRSTDGIAWEAEIQLTNTLNQHDRTPFAVAGTSPGVVELYWAQTPDLTSPSNIVRDGSIVVLDLIFASGFDQ